MTSPVHRPAPGLGSPGPGAVASAPFAWPAEVDAELTRVGRRWAQLDLARAAGSALAVHALASRYADLVHPDYPLPDLGPAVVVDQLRVVTYDALATGALDPALAAADLATLRRSLP